MSVGWAFFYGFLGAFLLNFTRLAELANLPKIERPDTFSDWVWVMQFFGMPLVGGALVAIYSADGVELKPLLAANIGISAPLIIKAMAAALPGQQHFPASEASGDT